MAFLIWMVQRRQSFCREVACIIDYKTKHVHGRWLKDYVFMEGVLYKWMCKHLTFEDLLAFFFKWRWIWGRSFSWQQGHYSIVSNVQQPVFSVCGAVDRNLIFLWEDHVIINFSSQALWHFWFEWCSDARVFSFGRLLALLSAKKCTRKMIERQGAHGKSSIQMDVQAFYIWRFASFYYSGGK